MIPNDGTPLSEKNIIVTFGDIKGIWIGSVPRVCQRNRILTKKEADQPRWQDLTKCISRQLIIAATLVDHW